MVKCRNGFAMLFCVLVLLVPYSSAFGQVPHPAPIKGYISADSAGVKAGRVVPSRMGNSLNHLPGVGLEATAVRTDTWRGPFLSSEEEKQWASFHFSGTQWEWNVRRPGEYAAQSLTGTVSSNADIMIVFSGFEDLVCSNPNSENVEALYGAYVGTREVDQVAWVTAQDFNGRTLLIQRPPGPPAPVPWCLWNRINVKAGNSAEEYADEAVITFLLKVNTTWTDPELTVAK
jgi:hypothetical protein